MPKARLLMLGICGMVSICATVAVERFWPPRTGPAATELPASLDARAVAPAIVRSLRPNYPYSVIPGGVYAADELRHAMRADGPVSQHYADFDASKVRFVTLPADSYRYVSYRLGGHIFWTRKKLLIPRGEVLFTDGRHYARTRCGNRLAEQASTEISAMEPPAKDLSRPTFSASDLQTPGVHFASAPTGVLLGSAAPLPVHSKGIEPNVPPMHEEIWLPLAQVRREFILELTPVSPEAFQPADPRTSGRVPSGSAPLPPSAPDVVAVPEPNGATLLAVGLLGSLFVILRRTPSHSR